MWLTVMLGSPSGLKNSRISHKFRQIQGGEHHLEYDNSSNN